MRGYIFVNGLWDLSGGRLLQTALKSLFAAVFLVALPAVPGCVEGTSNQSRDSQIEITPFGLDVSEGDYGAEVSTAPDGMVLIPAGHFMMGCNSAVDTLCEADELPYHQVYLADYYIDITEVTVSQYAACVDAGVCTPPFEPGSNCSWEIEGRDEYPMTCIDWFQSAAFCTWVGRRLPTEAEWEKAARGTDGRIYPWGNQVASCDYAVMADPAIDGRGCGREDVWPVCSKPAGNSPYGLCDMAGNVWERTADWYDEGYYAVSPETDPRGPVAGTGRVSRGGSIALLAGLQKLRASHRMSHAPSAVDGLLGFRCASDPGQ